MKLLIILTSLLLLTGKFTFCEETTRVDYEIETPLEDGEIEEESDLATDPDTLPSFLSPPANNLTQESDTNSTTNSTESTKPQHKFVACLPGYGTSQVQLLNDTEVMKLVLPHPNVTSKDAVAECIAVLFYSQHCPFSCLAAPHFNALPRSFPDIKMVAINAMIYNLVNTQNGVGGVPTLILFHNGRAVAKYNESEYNLELFSKFVSKFTGIVPEEKAFVTSADFSGPVSSVTTKVTDVYLGISWGFIILCAGYYFTKSKWWSWLVESVKSNWRESEAHAQHEHVE